MSGTVRAHWHKILQCVANRELYVIAPSGAVADHQEDVPGFAIDAFAHLLELVQPLPYFVFDSEVVEMISERDCIATLRDMKKAGVFRLPFPTMVVEVPSGGGCDVVVLRDRRADEKPPWRERYADSGYDPECEFYGITFMLRRDKDGEYALFGASTSYVDLGDYVDEGYQLRVGGVLSGAFDPQTPQERAKLNSILERTYTKLGQICGRALFCAVLMLATRGIAKEVIECEPLNRKRIASDKPPVPRHTYVHIGKVYRSAAPGAKADDYVPRRSPRPHWVRGFARRYHTGKDRAGPVVWKLIPPAFVAFHGDEVQRELAMAASPPEYDVRR